MLGENLRRWRACLVSGGTQTLIAAALVIFPWICCQTETKSLYWKVQGRCSGNRPTVWQTWMKEQTMIEKVVAKCLNMTKLWTLWRMWMASFKMFCCVVHVAKPCSMLCLFSVFIWGRGPTSWFFTGTSAGMAKRLPAPDTWVFANKSETGREYVSTLEEAAAFMKVAVRLVQSAQVWNVGADPSLVI